MPTTNLTHIAHLVEICAKRGVKHVVLSPGSRNAPLIIAFDEHPEIKSYLIHDERCAAFFAIGLAEALNEPVAICCTSGSAPLNYAPGIAEAYYRNIPLLILTADRPIALIDQGDGQTIRQKNVFQNFVKASFELPDFSLMNEINSSDETANRAIHQLLQKPQSPVHLNIPLSEPLYAITDLKPAPKIENFETQIALLNDSEKAEIEKVWTHSKKKLVLIGQLAPDLNLSEILSGIINDSSVAILVENTSNIQNFQKIVHCVDRTLAVIGEDEIENYQPDLLVTLGGAIVSKKIKAFFRTNKPKTNWRVGEFLFEEDTYQSLSRSFNCSANHFFEFVNSIKYNPDSNFGNQWKQKDFIAQELHLTYLKSIQFSDFKAFEFILDTLPDRSVLHMGNSSVVRYCQLFNPISGVNYFSNRGVSGIDGSTSTAAGFSVAKKDKLNVLISGDVSFFYDSNGLWNSYLTNNFRIIVINNGGGGIFQILDGSNSVKQAPIFFSPYQADIESICKAFSCNYFSASNLLELDEIAQPFYAKQVNNRPALLEVKTFSSSNAEVLKAYFNHLRKG